MGEYLESLYLSRNQLTKIENIATLTKLKELWLSNNQLIKIENIETLTNLQTLYLSNNQLTKIENIKTLTNLQRLYLHNNQLAKIENIETLSNLVYLHLYTNQLTKIENIETLTDLQTLDLSDNQLTKIENIATLTKLETLDLFHNQLTKIENIATLTNLEVLWLSNNQLTKIENIATLTNLQALYLDSNQLTEIENIEHLTNFQHLHLQENTIETLPEYFEKLDKLTTNLLAEKHKDYFWKKGLRLHDNHFPISEAVFDWESPQEIISHILRIQAKKAAGEVKPLLEAKVMFVGDSEVGKTHLIELMLKQKIERTIHSTHGIERNCLQMGEVKANIWDLGGQKYMHSTHQFFFTALSVYVLVAQSRKERKEINLWMQQVRQWGGENAPVVVVGNKSDLNEGHFFPETEILRDYPNILGFVYTNIHDLASVEKLTATITAILADKKRMKWVYEERENEWHAIKTAIETESQSQEYMSYDGYLKLCRSCVPNMPDDICRQTLRLLNATGTVVSFVEDRRLEETQVLNPQWVVDGVYAIINDKQVKETQKGYFTEADLADILAKIYKNRFPTHKHLYLTDLMKKFRVAYPLERQANTQRAFMIPVLFDDVEVEYKDWNTEKALCFRYDYGQFAPDDILPELIVENYKLIFDGNLRWKRGIYLRYKEEACIAKIYGSYKDNFIEIEINGTPHLQRDALVKVRQSLEKLNDLRHLQPERYVMWEKKPLSYEDLLYWRKENMRKTKVRHFGEIDVDTVWNNFELPDRDKMHQHLHIHTPHFDLKHEGDLTIYYTQQIENYIEQAALATSAEGKSIVQALQVFETADIDKAQKDQILAKIAELLQSPTESKLKQVWKGFQNFGLATGKTGIQNVLLKIAENGIQDVVAEIGKWLVHF